MCVRFAFDSITSLHLLTWTKLIWLSAIMIPSFTARTNKHDQQRKPINDIQLRQQFRDETFERLRNISWRHRRSSMRLHREPSLIAELLLILFRFPREYLERHMSRRHGIMEHMTRNSWTRTSNGFGDALSNFDCRSYYVESGFLWISTWELNEIKWNVLRKVSWIISKRRW